MSCLIEWVCSFFLYFVENGFDALVIGEFLNHFGTFAYFFQQFAQEHYGFFWTEKLGTEVAGIFHVRSHHDSARMDWLAWRNRPCPTVSVCCLCLLWSFAELLFEKILFADGLNLAFFEELDLFLLLFVFVFELFEDLFVMDFKQVDFFVQELLLLSLALEFLVHFLEYFFHFLYFVFILVSGRGLAVSGS